MTDQEILNLFREASYRKGMKAVYPAYAPIRRMVLINSGSKEDAEDLFQEVLLVWLEKTKDEAFELKAGLKTYLYAVARNLWLKTLREKGKESKALAAETDAQQEHEESRFSLAEEALKQLGEKCRELLVLFYYRRLSFETIAGQLGFSSDKVAKNQKYRCLEKAKENYSLLKAAHHGI